MGFETVDLNSEYINYEISAFIVSQSAALHASWWEDSALSRIDRIREDDLPDFSEDFRQNWTKFPAVVQDFITDEMRVFGDQLVNHIERVKAHLCQSPRTILHGDFHGWNILIDGAAAPREMVVIDWQGVSTGRGVRDLAFLFDDYISCGKPPGA